MLKLPALLPFLRDSLRALLGTIIAGSVMSWFIWRRCCETTASLYWIIFFTVSLWISLWWGNAYVSTWLDNIFSWHKDPVKRLVAGLVGMTVYTVGIVFGIMYGFDFAFGFNVGNRLEGTFLSTIVITLIITMFMTGRSFLLNWRQSAVDAERLQKESVTAQYNSLRNQVNPHFLFNSLNALTGLVHKNPDEAVKFIKQLSTVYRYVLDTRDKELVQLSAEVEFLRSYLFLQQIRFGEKLKLEVDLNETGLVAPLVLQMLVENAIKHNIIADEQPLTIRVYCEAEILIVENTLQKKSIPSVESTGAGLENIKRRYTFLSSVPVKVEESERLFRVSVPIIFTEAKL
ncbi:MAG: histidine kinase [Cyclobacteriaceae bacterium]|nr:histidine kinase [Cyclobacteriaceae bacterium]